MLHWNKMVFSSTEFVERIKIKAIHHELSFFFNAKEKEDTLTCPLFNHPHSNITSRKYLI